jgi:hypothetical protein
MIRRVWFSLSVCFLALLALSQTNPPRVQEQYQATAFLQNTVPPASLQVSAPNIAALDFYVDSYTPDDEYGNLVKISQTEGSKGLEKAFDKLPQRGRVSQNKTASDSLGCSNGVKLARQVVNGPEKVVRLVMKCDINDYARQLSGVRDFKFRVVELRVNPNGQNRGVFVSVAKISFDDQGRMQVQPFDQTTVINLGSVRQVK